MKKSNKKGFILAETIAVSVVIMTALVIIYTQFMTISKSYARTFTYNSVNNMYLVNNVKEYIKDDGFDKLIEELDNKLYIDITSCPTSYFINYIYCRSLVENSNIKQIIFTKQNLEELENNLDDGLSEKMKQFIKSINYDDVNNHRLIVEFNDETYATLVVSNIKEEEFAMEPVEFDYTGGEQVFTVPHSGYYKLEVWGAQGGYAASSTKGSGGYGGYSSGNIYLTKNTNLFVYVGGKGQDAQSVNKGYTGGYNGGASSKPWVNTYNGAGGGATHIALEGGLLSTLSSKVSSILIVAGGGGGSASNGTTFILGASGGGYIGNNGMKPPNNDGAFGLGGTQTAGGSYTLYTYPQTPPTPGSFGQGGNPASHGGAGGGAGYYGGGGASIWGSAGAGSGYIGNTNLIDKNMYCYNCSTSNDQSTRTYSTTNVSETPTSQYAKIGNGYAKITYIGENL